MMRSANNGAFFLTRRSSDFRRILPFAFSESRRFGLAASSIPTDSTHPDQRDIREPMKEPDGPIKRVHIT
jgi:hypothetical protein